ncbi:M23 family metallopeptidase [Pedobacter sp. KACC 23697]|uniref:M23 family metallopeptidase n=1 Tax=Pedobacter sp. KACC 23697 TaxID=3149230 RepID=A0AAU7K6F3_9SPHI
MPINKFNAPHTIKLILLALACLIVLFNIVELFEKITFPVDSQITEWNTESFWKAPWGNSSVHRGVDLFDDLGAKVINPSSGLVLKSGFSNNGGNYVYIISPSLKVYYFAHLSKRLCQTGNYIRNGEPIGLVGDSGNARYSPFHLHFSIFSCVPIFRHYDFKAVLGWQKMFYLNPLEYLKND